MDIQEIRAKALEQAVTVTCKAPIFRGSMYNPEVIEYTTDEIMSIALSYEIYIATGDTNLAGRG